MNDESTKIKGAERKGGIMKTIALLALLTIGLVTTAGCHWRHHRHYSHHYSDGHYRR